MFEHGYNSEGEKPVGPWYRQLGKKNRYGL